MTAEHESGEWKKTACILCAVNCGLEVQVSGARITRIRGDKVESGVAGLRLREVAAHGPLPERRRPH